MMSLSVEESYFVDSSVLFVAICVTNRITVVRVISGVGDDCLLL
jgi:hypothetical protein